MSEMHVAERQGFSNARVRHRADVEEANDLIRSGDVREALKTLMRDIPDEFERPSSKALGSSSRPACLTTLCFALLGMYADAKDWCAGTSRGTLDAYEFDDEGAHAASCLRLWCLVAEGDLPGATELCHHFLGMQELRGDVLASGVAGMVVLALKLEDHTLAKEIASLVSEPGPGAFAHLGAALLTVCRAEIDFREILRAMPECKGSVGAPYELAPDQPALDRLTLASQAESLAARMAAFEKRLNPWPLLQEVAVTMRLASQTLALQFLGRAVDLSCLETRVGSFNARGLVPLYRHGRFLLALLNLHQGRPATAQNWLASGRAAELETRVHLLAANVRAFKQDWSQAFELYRYYVKTASAQGRIAGELRARLIAAHASHRVRPALGGKAPPGRRSTHPALQANESRFVNEGHAPQGIALRRALGSETADAIRDLIEQDLGQPLLVRDIAERLGIARRTVENRVRIESGHSVKRFVTALRLEHAYRLVQDAAPVNAHGLQAIAAQVGFTSYRTFCAAYTKAFGRIPHRRGRP